MKKNTKPPSLDVLDNKLMDGLRFCTKVYNLYEDIRAQPDGLKKIRLIDSKLEKRLLEELFPIVQYIQVHYRSGNRFKVRWLSGSQSYDAIIWTPFLMVKNTTTPRKIYLEVTMAIHQNAHLVRQEIHQKGGSFGPKNISRDRKTGEIKSTPHVYGGDHITELAQQIVDRLAAKSAKPYPKSTILIVNCHPNGLILQDEWLQAVEIVKATGAHGGFRQVFLFESRGHLWATLWGTNKMT
jgi:hypothetical protein